MNSVNNSRHRTSEGRKRREVPTPGCLRSDEFVGGRLKLKLKSQHFFLLCVCVCQLPFFFGGGDEILQIYGKFEEFTLICIVYLGDEQLLNYLGIIS